MGRHKRRWLAVALASPVPHYTSCRQLSFAEVFESYPTRNPSETVLYKVVAENLETFLQLAESDPNRKGLPEYVKKEFYDYLGCGILANGFLRLQCESCKHERLLPFSCKGRGFCPSCGGRRMSELAAFLVDEVIAHVPIRQIVLSFPFPIRFWIAKNPKLQSKLLTTTIRAIRALYLKKAKKMGYANKCEIALVTVIQRFGGSINLNPHFHMLWVDGVYDVSTDEAKFQEAIPPTDEEIRSLTETLSKRILKYLKKKGYPIDDERDNTHDDNDETFFDVQAASVSSTIALGERSGQKVRRLGLVTPGNFEGARIDGERCASYKGFSLHANVSTKAFEREKLERLVRYIARPPVAMDRLHQRPDGLITYRLKKKYKDGTERLLFSPLELLEKLSAIVPKPRTHVTRYHGLFAPNSKHRSKIVKGKVNEKKKVKADTDSELPERPEKTKSKMSWAKLLNRVFKRDVTECHFCRGKVKVVSAILEEVVIERILTHLELPATIPDIKPARPPPQEEFEGF